MEPHTAMAANPKVAINADVDRGGQCIWSAGCCLLVPLSGDCSVSSSLTFADFPALDPPQSSVSVLGGS